MASTIRIGAFLDDPLPPHGTRVNDNLSTRRPMGELMIPGTKSPRPDETDVRLHVDIHGTPFDYAACESAAREFVLDHHARHYLDDAIITPDDTNGLPRLPCERLYLEH
ncbi:hypothetical protein [Nocardia callitridis]|uniref:Uncharacterized protein n=1 Tax=Nocardia callitridis TaxID=648753 RepID=A0ABP9KHJ4_9NOCA